MSKENLDQFIQKVADDEQLQARIGEEIDIDSLIALGAEHGCEFTAEDLAQNVELSDKELDGVAGGVSAIKNKQEPFREVEKAERSLTGGNSTKYSIGRSPTKYTDVDWS
jgi:predicted ribosomally synthesized peptide with nif11-like leader